ncbi:GntR family transcriptional regulator [Sphingomonas sp. DT-204]|uniref:GntR family transcriptional regulator n=1 Tax=Sphingomonas sp. DT-204 TaxID=3396166 RepID=UPI003F195828
MNSGTTTERVYEALKLTIMRRGIRPGARLDPAVLAAELGSSVTPVREALHILEGEALVETRHGGGFWLPHVDEPGLRDLYAWSCDILLLAVRRMDAADGSASLAAPLDDPADHAARLFLRVARLSANAEHHRAMAAANDRLHAARTVEPMVIAGIPDELSAIGAALDGRDTAALRRLVVAYHRRRQRLAAEILRRLYREEQGAGAI